MTIEQQIQQQRQQIEQARQRLEASKPQQLTQQQIIRGQGGVQSQLKRLQEREVRQNIDEAQSNLQQQERRFELEVARKAPSLAKEEYRSLAIEEARNSLQSKINSLQRDIQSAKGSERGNLVRQLRTLQELGRRLSPEELVIATQTGELTKIAKSQALLTDPNRLRNLQINKIEQRLGMSLTPEAIRNIEWNTGQLQQSLTNQGLREAIDTYPQSKVPTVTTKTINVPQQLYSSEQERLRSLGFSNQEVQRIVQESINKQQSLAVAQPTGVVGEARRLAYKNELLVGNQPSLATGIKGYTETGKPIYESKPLGEVILEYAPATRGIATPRILPRGVTTEETIVRVAQPKTAQIVSFNPKIKGFEVITKENIGSVLTRPKGVIVETTDTGLLRIRKTFGRNILGRRVIRKVETQPIIETSVGTIQEREGLFKIISNRQATTLKPTPLDKILGRTFSKLNLKTQSNIGQRISTDSFFSATKLKPTEFSAKGFATTRQIKPTRIQRTGEVFGVGEQVGRGITKIQGEDAPFVVFEQVGGFRPLFRREPLQLSSGRTVVVGTPSETEQVLSLRLQQEPALIKSMINRPSLQLETTRVIEETRPLPRGVPLEQQSTRVISGVNFNRPQPNLVQQEEILNQPLEISRPFQSPIQEITQRRTSTSRQMDEALEKVRKQQQRELQTITQVQNVAQQQAVAQQQDFRLRFAQAQIPFQEQQLRQLTTQRTSRIPRTPRTQIPRIPRIVPPFSLPSSSPRTQTPSPREDKLLKAFRVLVKRRGKFEQVGNLLPKGRALRLGQDITLNTLASTFKLEETNLKTRLKDVSTSLSKEFRDFRIQRGKQIPLQNTFIERRRFRLSSRPEIKEIQRARRRK